MEKLRELRDQARERGQLSAAIQAEVKRGELTQFDKGGIQPQVDGPAQPIRPGIIRTGSER
jgi:hypothetical protein